MKSSDLPAFTKASTHYRWTICALLFVITTINYMDRNILGVLKPTIQNDLNFSETDFGNIIFFFSIAYAIGYAGMGWLTDKIGICLGLAAAATLWCFASTAHGMVASVSGFIVARVALGLGEGGNFPTCIKTIATWFPVRDRALATGIQQRQQYRRNAGSADWGGGCQPIRLAGRLLRDRRDRASLGGVLADELPQPRRSTGRVPANLPISTATRKSR